MARNGSGTYSLAAGNPVSSGGTISSTWANDTLNDLALEMTSSLDRNGKGGMLAELRGVDGSSAAAAYSWTSETNTGAYRVSAGVIGFAILGTKMLEFNASGIKADVIAELTATAGVTIDGLLIKDSSIPEAAVTEHEAALTITEAQISDLGTYLVAADVTYELLDANGDVGPGASQVATGDHTHAGVYEPADAAIVKSDEAETISAAWTFGKITFGAEFVETVYALSTTTPALDPANGTVQTWTLSGNSTPTDSLAAGESITIHILDGTAYTITWPTMEWVGGSAPTLDTTNETIVQLWKVGTTLYGALVGVAS